MVNAILDNPNIPVALDEQGNVWCFAWHAISVKDGFFANLMIKTHDIKDVKSISQNAGMILALKKDGTVWTIEQLGKNSNLNERASVKLGEQIPKLKDIVKVDVAGMIGMAIDKYGKVWMFEAAPGMVKDDPFYASLKTEPIQIEGIDHVTDMLISYDLTFLKEDGTVWNYDGYVPRHSANWSFYDSIRDVKPVQFKNLKDIVKLGGDHYALDKDGNVWTWGRTILSKDQDGLAEVPAAPYRMEELNDVVDFASGNDHALFVKKDGTVWGLGYFIEKWGALGARPERVWKDLFQLEGIENAASVKISILSGDLTTDSVIKKDGTVWMWGIDQFQNLVKKPQQVEFRN